MKPITFCLGKPSAQIQALLDHFGEAKPRVFESLKALLIAIDTQEPKLVILQNAKRKEIAELTAKRGRSGWSFLCLIRATDEFPDNVGLNPAIDAVFRLPVMDKDLLFRLSDLLSESRRRPSSHDTLDPLTQCWNNDEILRRLNTALMRSDINADHIACVLINMDQFKQFNDQMGHAAGDRILLKMARLLSEEIEGQHHIGRMSGDEFLVIIEKVEEEDIDSIGIRLHQKVGVENWGTPKGLEMSISTGISLYPGDGLTSKDLLESAERALYAAKAAGGDRFVKYTDLAGRLESEGMAAEVQDFIHFAQVVARQVSDDIVNRAKRIIDQLQKQTRIDPLLKIPNRRAFDEFLSSAFHRFNRYDTPFCLLILDIDNFGAFNKEFDVTVGDQALRTMARILAAEIREVDVLARYGGEELGIILHESEMKTAHLVANRLRMAVEAHGFNGKTVTVSGGISQVKRNDTPNTIVERASTALNKAKGAGKNCIKTENDP